MNIKNKKYCEILFLLNTQYIRCYEIFHRSFMHILLYWWL